MIRVNGQTNTGFVVLARVFCWPMSNNEYLEWQQTKYNFMITAHFTYTSISI